MSQNSLWSRTAATRHRLVTMVAVAAIVALLRERSFSANRAKYGSIDERLQAGGA